VNLDENTQLDTRIAPSYLTLTATGTAYFVASCGELLAWIGSALLSITGNIGSYFIPLITSFSLDSAPSNSALLKYKGNCDIGFEVAKLETSNYSLPRIKNREQGSVGENGLILGFPILRRPEGYPGLEVSFGTLLYSVQATNAILLEGNVVIKGLERRLKLVKHRNSVFLWHLLHPLADECSCWVDHHEKTRVIKPMIPLTFMV